MTLLDRILAMHVRVVFKRLPERTVGYSIKDSRTIEIDLRSVVNPVKVFVHECIHLLEPTWNEKKVLQAESKVWRKTSRYDRYRLAKKLYGRKYVGKREDM